MATLKKQAVKLARRLRKDTGLPFTDCHTMAKCLVRSKPFPEALKRHVKVVTYCDCCGPERTVVGPAGEFDEMRYSLFF